MLAGIVRIFLTWCLLHSLRCDRLSALLIVVSGQLYINIFCSISCRLSKMFLCCKRNFSYQVRKTLLSIVLL